MSEPISSRLLSQANSVGESGVIFPSSDSHLTGPTRREKHRHPVRSIGAMTGLVVAIVLFALAIAPRSTYSEVNSPLFGHPAPMIAGTSISGEDFNLATLRGHFVVVDFFASWCIPCRIEQPQLVTFAERQRNGAHLIGVIFEDSVAAARSLLGPWVGLYPVQADPGGTIAFNYGVFNPPSKYVIDPKGRVVAKLIGAVTASELDAIIAKSIRNGL